MLNNIQNHHNGSSAIFVDNNNNDNQGHIEWSHFIRELITIYPTP